MSSLANPLKHDSGLRAWFHPDPEHMTVICAGEHLRPAEPLRVLLSHFVADAAEVLSAQPADEEGTLENIIGIAAVIRQQAVGLLAVGDLIRMGAG